MKKVISLLLALAVLFALAGCAPKENATPTDGTSPAAEDKGTLVVAGVADMTTMDVAQTTADYFVPNNIFDRLFEVEVQEDGSSAIVGSVCEDYTLSPDGLTYAMKIREGITFSNGSALTATDVKYTFVRLLTAGGVNDDIPLEVEGAEALQNGEADDLSGIVLKDDYNMEITLSAPNAGFTAELTSPAMGIVDKETMETVQNFGMDPKDTIGSGPYIITEWVANDHHTLVRNENYWGEKPQVKTLIKKIVPDAATQNLMFQNGELDLIDLDYLDPSIVSNTYKTTYQDKLFSAPRVGVTYMAMNEENEFLQDVRVRKAIQMAINRDNLVTGILGGDGVLENGIIPSGIWGFNPDFAPITYDPEGAKELLAQTGFQNISFELAYDSSSASSTEMAYQLIQQDLKAVGITVEIKSYDESAWLDLRKSGEMDAFIGTWTMDYNDPANIMATFFGSAEKTALRSINYYDEAIMARVAAASKIVDDDTRMAEYRALEEKIVAEDAAWVPLYAKTHLFAVSDKIADFVPHWAGYSDFFIRDITLA